MKRSVSLLLSEDVGSGTRTRSVSMSSSTSPSSCNKSKARKTNSLPVETVEYLKSWMMSPEHIAHPYPTDLEKAQIMADTGIELKQLTNWFVNNRKRFWKPRVESKLGHEGVTRQVSAPAAVTPEHTSKAIVPMDGLSLKSAMMKSFLDDASSKSGMSPSSSSSSLNSPARVSDQSVMSETDSLSSSDGSSVEDELLLMPSTSGGQDSSEDPTDLVVQTERVNVHILRPVVGSTPTVEDVTVLNNVPGDRVLKSYLNCPLTYMVSSDAINNSNEVSSEQVTSPCQALVPLTNLTIVAFLLLAPDSALS
jgi:Homeobox KN domain